MHATPHDFAQNTTKFGTKQIKRLPEQNSKPPSKKLAQQRTNKARTSHNYFAWKSLNNQLNPAHTTPHNLGKIYNQIRPNISNICNGKKLFPVPVAVH